MRLLAICFVGLVFMAVRYADLPIGRALHRALIVAPASWLTKTPPQRIAIILFLLVGASLAWMELGPLLMAADYSPFLWIADMSVYLDALVTITVVATALRVKYVGQVATVLLRKAGITRPLHRRSRARSSNSRRMKLPPPTNDDAPAFAAYLAA
jgi:hypothetical protein